MTDELWSLSFSCKQLIEGTVVLGNQAHRSCQVDAVRHTAFNRQIFRRYTRSVLDDEGDIT